ncbi:MAG: diguanylate cyclase, partial [Thiobacillus sp.]|nr:diguanylate cyclase [Thiobacillus sp.]
ERLRAAIAAARPAPGIPVTASVGVAQRTDAHATLDALIAAADECLYQAKQQGRNRVVGSPLPPAAAPVTLARI